MNLLLAVTINNTENLAERSKLLLAKRRIDDVLLATKYPKWVSKLMNCFSKNCSLPIVKWFVRRRLPILQWGSQDPAKPERKTKVLPISLVINFINVSVIVMGRVQNSSGSGLTLAFDFGFKLNGYSTF